MSSQRSALSTAAQRYRRRLRQYTSAHSSAMSTVVPNTTARGGAGEEGGRCVRGAGVAAEPRHMQAQARGPSGGRARACDGDEAPGLLDGHGGILKVGLDLRQRLPRGAQGQRRAQQSTDDDLPGRSKGPCSFR